MKYWKVIWFLFIFDQPVVINEISFRRFYQLYRLGYSRWEHTVSLHCRRIMLSRLGSVAKHLRADQLILRHWMKYIKGFCASCKCIWYRIIRIFVISMRNWYYVNEKYEYFSMYKKCKYRFIIFLSSVVSNIYFITVQLYYSMKYNVVSLQLFDII